MATATHYRRPSGIRNQVFQADSGGLPSSPRTPNQPTSSAFSSPSIGGKTEEEPLIFEFGTRFLRAGPARDRLPLCTIRYGPLHQQRAGDYRYWEPEHARQTRNRRSYKNWTDAFELWPLDLRDVNLGLVEDKVERYVRQVYSRYLMMDPRFRRILLVLPPAFPHALLSILLVTLFGTFQCPGVSLFSASVLSAVAAGVRSALVVDIGWYETVITAVYEYREIHSCRSVRGGKKLAHEMRKHLIREIQKARSQRETKKTVGEKNDGSTQLSVDEVEDVLVRFAWCRGLARSKQSSVHFHSGNEQHPEPGVAGSESQTANIEDDSVHPIYLKSTRPPMKLTLPFSSFAEPVEAALFSDTGMGGGLPDDEERPVGQLAYNTLMSVSMDARSVCMSRIIVVGGPSGIPGLKKRVVDEVSSLCSERGSRSFSRRPAPAKAESSQKTPAADSQSSDAADQQVTSGTASASDGPAPVEPSAAFAEQEMDHITEHFRRTEAKDSKPVVHGMARGVESLGAWSGASLVAAMKIKGVVEVERDKFLQHGLAGANRDAKYSVVPSRSTASKAPAGDRSSWTLGVWA